MLRAAFNSVIDVISRTFDAGTLTVEPFTMSFFPCYNFSERTAHLAVALVTRVTDSADSSSHTVVISVQKDEFTIWCGDTFLDGRSADIEQRIASATSEAKGEVQSRVKEQMEKIAGGYPQVNQTCDFWTHWRSSKGNHLCDHTKAALAVLGSDLSVLTRAESLYAAATDPLVPYPLDGAGDTGLTLASLAFRVPVLIEGDRGSGKTRAARKFARERSLKFIELPGHEGVEAQDMLGYLIPDGRGGLVWKDGPLAEAFRSAKKTKTVLLIDELLRIPQRQLSILLTALSPDEGRYRLRTGRVVSIEDGIAQEEVIEIEVSQIAVIATTNVGAEYAVDVLDPALAERFFLIRKDTEEGELKTMLTELLSMKDFALVHVARLTDFWKKSTELQAQGRLNQAPTMRTLALAVDLANKAEDLRNVLKSMALQWVARDANGRPAAEQVKIIEALVDNTNPELVETANV